MDLAKNLRDKERFNAKVSIVEQGHEPEDFWKTLNGKPEGNENIPGKEASGDDEEAEKSYMSYVTLYKAVYNKNENSESDVDLERVGEEGKALVKSMLFEGNCYILDCISEIYAWTSMKAAGDYRKATLKKANDIYSDRKSQFWVSPVYHEWAGSEQIKFRERFFDWNTVPIAVQAPAAPKRQQPGLSQAVEQRFDVTKMYAEKEDKDDIMIDEGCGGVKIFLVEEFKRAQLGMEAFGEFYSGESYIIAYVYLWKNKECHVIYYWQGKNSTIVKKNNNKFYI